MDVSDSFECGIRVALEQMVQASVYNEDVQSVTTLKCSMLVNGGKK